MAKRGRECLGMEQLQQALEATADDMHEINLLDMLEQLVDVPDSVDTPDKLFHWMIDAGMISPENVQTVCNMLECAGVHGGYIQQYIQGVDVRRAKR